MERDEDQNQEKKLSANSNSTAIFVSAAVLIILLLVWWQAGMWYESQLLAEEQFQVESQLIPYGNSLTTTMNRHFAQLEGLGAFAQLHDAEEELDDNFESFASGIYSENRGIRAIQLFPAFSLEYVYPISTNEAVVGRKLDDLLNDERPNVRADVQRTVSTRQIALSGPYDLRQGGLGMIARLAVYQNDTFWGLAVIVLDVPPVLNNSGLDSIPQNIEFALRDTNDHVFFGSQTAFSEDPIVYNVSLPEGNWELAALPAGGWDAAIKGPLTIFRIVGLLVAALITSVFYLTLTYHKLLKRSIKENTYALTESQSNYQQLFNGNQDALFVLDEKGSILNANKTVCEEYGYDMEELRNMSVLDLSISNLHEKALSHIKDAFDHNVRFQWNHKRKDGYVFPVDISAGPFYMDGRKYILASVRNISEQVLSKKALVESEERYRKLISEMSNGFALHEMLYDEAGKPYDYRFLEVNSAFEQITGLDSTDIVGKTVLEILPETEPTWIELYERVISEGKPLRVEKYAKEMAKDFEVLAYSPHEKQFVTIFTDISVRVHAEKLLRESESKYRALVEQSLTGIYIFEHDKFLYVNHRFAEMFGYSENEILSDLVPTDVIENEDKKMASDYVDKRLSGEIKTANYIAKGKRKDNAPLWVEIHGNSMELNGRLVVTGTVLDITERVQAEEELRRSEERFRRAVESAPFPIMIHTQDGEILSLSHSWLKITGYDRDEISTIDEWTKMAYGTQAGGIINEIHDLYTLDERRETNGRIVTCKDGSKRVWNFISTPLGQLLDGRNIAISMAADVTDIKRSEEKFIKIFNATPDSISLTSLLTGEIIDINKKFEEITGISKEESVGKIFSELGLWSDMTAREQFMTQLHENGFVTDFETELTTKSGEKKYGIVSGDIISTNSEKLLLGIFRDITSRRLAEMDLEESKRLLSEVGKIAKVGGWEFDASSGKGTWTPEVARIHGLDPATEANVELGLSFYSPDSRKLIENAVKDAIEKGEPYDLELELVSAEGEHKWIHTIGHPIKKKGKVVKVTGSFQDITELKMASENIRQLNAELEKRVLERTAQLEATNKELEAFSYSVSHDLRSPLRSIDGFSKIIVEDYEDALDDEGKRLLNIVRTNTQKMDQLITDLLSLSRIGQNVMNFADIDMNAMARSVYSEVASSEEQEKIVLSISDLPEGYGDSALIKQVWSNLFSNAIKYSMPKEHPIIELGGYTEKGVNTYYIKDNGVGFNSQYKDKLFVLFQRLHTRNEFEGTGVGLAIVQRIINRHGGRVWGDGETHKGAEFYFSLRKKEVDHE